MNVSNWTPHGESTHLVGWQADVRDRRHPVGFLWWNSTRLHIWTRLKKESEGKTGLGIYPDGMVEHDGLAVKTCCPRSWPPPACPT